MNKRWFAAFLVLCLPVLLAQSSARTTGHKVLPAPSCTEDWVEFSEQNPGLAQTLSNAFTFRPLLEDEVDFDEIGTLVECFEWGIAGSIHIKYVCSDRYFKIEVAINAISNTTGKAYGFIVGHRGDATLMDLGDIVFGTLQVRYHAATAVNLTMTMFTDILLQDGDHIALLVGNVTGTGTPTVTPQRGTKLTFTSTTCTRGTPS